MSWGIERYSLSSATRIFRVTLQQPGSYQIHVHLQRFNLGALYCQQELISSSDHYDRPIRGSPLLLAAQKHHTDRLCEAGDFGSFQGVWHPEPTMHATDADYWPESKCRLAGAPRNMTSEFARYIPPFKWSKQVVYSDVN